MPFLKDKKRKELIETLTLGGMDKTIATRMVTDDLPDDLIEVDLSMTAHILSIAHFRKESNLIEAAKGMLILVAFMEEAMERGLGENDFPMSLQAIKDDLGERGMMTIQ